MSVEIERRFLVSSGAWRAGAAGVLLKQGYLSTDPDRTVRVRIEGARARLTIKGRKVGASAPEFEYDIPYTDAEALLALAEQPILEKTRYTIVHAGSEWTLDEFHGANAPLVLAEIELASEDQPFVRPDWLGEEVTADHRYANASLSRRPYGSEAWARGAP